MTKYGADQDATFVSIYCDDSHPEDRWLVATYYPVADSEPAQWSEHRSYYQKPGAEFLVRISAPAENGSAYLAGDHVVTADKRRNNPDALNRGDSRTRLSLKCGRCSTSVAARSESIFPIFDLLATAGVQEVSLTAIAARLRRR